MSYMDNLSPSLSLSLSLSLQFLFAMKRMRIAINGRHNLRYYFGLPYLHCGYSALITLYEL